jgi:hypothetical protein
MTDWKRVIGVIATGAEAAKFVDLNRALCPKYAAAVIA